MGKYAHIAFSKGDTMRRQRELETAIQSQQTARTAEHTSIGKDGLRIFDKGNLTVDDGGNIHVNDGGQVNVRDGGQVITRHPNGIASTWAGSFVDDGEPGYGFLVQREDATDVFAATERASGTRVRFGNLPTPVTQFTVYSLHAGMFGDFSVSLISEGTFGVLVEARDGPINLTSTGGTFISHTTTGSSANCVIGTDGLIQRSNVSSRRYKQEIQDAELDPGAVLQMRPRTWRDRGEAEKEPNTQSRYIGFIAEELHELGLGEFLGYDDQGRPDSIHYDRLTAAVIPVLKQQQLQLETLSARLDALEATNAS
jgi:hypothetical protein